MSDCLVRGAFGWKMLGFMLTSVRRSMRLIVLRVYLGLAFYPPVIVSGVETYVTQTELY